MWKYIHLEPLCYRVAPTEVSSKEGQTQLLLCMQVGGISVIYFPRLRYMRTLVDPNKVTSLEDTVLYSLLNSVPKKIGLAGKKY